MRDTRNLACLIVWLWRKPPASPSNPAIAASGSSKWDWVLIGIFLIFSTWMMFKTLNMSDGVIEIS